MIKKMRKTNINKTSTLGMTMLEFVSLGDRTKTYQLQTILLNQIKHWALKTICLNLAISIWMTGETWQITITGHLFISIGLHQIMMPKNNQELHQFQPSLGAQKISQTSWKLFHPPAESEYWHWNHLQLKMNHNPIRQILSARWI